MLRVAIASEYGGNSGSEAPRINGEILGPFTTEELRTSANAFRRMCGVVDKYWRQVTAQELSASSGQETCRKILLLLPTIRPYGEYKSELRFLKRIAELLKNLLLACRLEFIPESHTTDIGTEVGLELLHDVREHFVRSAGEV